MARPRTFDESVVLTSALLTFWRYGYESTSIGKLEAELGISRISIYNTFGDKHKLFLLALKQYSNESKTFFTSTEFSQNGLNSIIQLFKSAQDIKDPHAPEHNGCLMLNTIFDIDSVGEEAKVLVQNTRDAMINGFQAAMSHAISCGEMKEESTSTIKERAEFLVSVMWGARITARLYSDTAHAISTAKTMVPIVNSWRKTGEY